MFVKILSEILKIPIINVISKGSGLEFGEHQSFFVKVLQDILKRERKKVNFIVHHNPMDDSTHLNAPDVTDDFAEKNTDDN